VSPTIFKRLKSSGQADSGIVGNGVSFALHTLGDGVGDRVGALVVLGSGRLGIEGAELGVDEVSSVGGAVVGYGVRLLVGAPVEGVGSDEGESVGGEVGASVGVSEGEEVGDMVVHLVGDGVAMVGSDEGESVGGEVGVSVGG